MKSRYIHVLQLIVILLCAATLNAGPRLTKQTLNAWTNYIDLTEKGIDAELKNTPVLLRTDITYLKTGKIQIERLTTRGREGKEIDIPDGTVHHWMGGIFIPGVTLDKMIPWLQNYPQYQDYFKEVERSAYIRPPSGDTFDIFLRLTRSKLGVAAHFNTRHNVVYSRKSATFSSSVSRSTEIRQLQNAGTPDEKEYAEGEDSGYLWRLNSYWRFNQRDGGVVVECETIGLSRSLGWGLGLLNFLTLGKVKSIAESVAREALEDTLTGLRDGVRGGPRKQTRR